LLLKKSELLRRRVIIEDLKIIRVEVADEAAFLSVTVNARFTSSTRLENNYAAGTRYPARLC